MDKSYLICRDLKGQEWKIVLQNSIYYGKFTAIYLLVAKKQTYATYEVII